MPSDRRRLLELVFGNRGGYVEYAIGNLFKKSRAWIEVADGIDGLCAIPTNQVVYYGPAIRQRPRKMGKSNIVGANVCWADVDKEDYPISLLQPSAIVFSGHGWHLYWRLEEFCGETTKLETANKALAHCIGGDSAHNCDRFLRVPNTENDNGAEPTRCELRFIDPTYVYDLDTLTRLALIPKRIIRKIVTGDRRGYPSRSERDMAIVRGLCRAGFDDDFVRRIFTTHKCGDKYRDRSTNGESYLNRTIERVRESIGDDPSDDADVTKATEKAAHIVEVDNCYYVVGARGQRKVSTFVFEPKMLIEGPDEDSVVGSIKASCTDYEWQDVVIPQSAFRGLAHLNRYLTKMSWTWLGKDADVRMLQAYLTSKLEAIGIPRTCAVNVIGRHTIENDDRVYFVTNDGTLCSDGSKWCGPANNPLMYIETGREAPLLKLDDDSFTRSELDALIFNLPRLNEPQRIWPMIGWFMASPLKPAIESCGYRFPTLNVTGTRGSGKTTLITDVFQRMLGYARPRTYSSGTTHYVALSLLGSSNAIPVSFAEFRTATSEEFLRFVLLSYDTGRDARGRPDQTTVEYPLTAPMTLDGEDMISDPAALERSVVVNLSHLTVEEGSSAFNAYQEIRRLPLNRFSSMYLPFTLVLDVEYLLEWASGIIHEHFRGKLPTRVRSNMIVCYAGALAYCNFLRIDEPSPELWKETLEHVYSSKMGRAPTAADDFCEWIANQAARGSETFPWKMSGGILWFQLTPAFESYRRSKILQRASTLGRDAMRSQLRDLTGDYTAAAQAMEINNRKVLVYGIDLGRAHAAGLDVPEGIKTGTITLRL